MRILMLSSAVAGRGGIEIVVGRVIHALHQKGHEVHLALSGPSRIPGWEAQVNPVAIGPQALSGAGLKRNFLPLIRWTLNLMKITQPDVVVALTPQAVIMAKWLTIPPNRPVAIVSWVHQPLEHLRHPWALKWAHSHLAVSTGLRDQLHRLTPRTPTYTIFNPIVEPSQLIMRPPANAPVSFISIGRLDDTTKRIRWLLRALAAVPEGWTFTIIGDGPDRTALHHLGTRLGISHAVDWQGWQNSPWNTIRHASAFLFASKSEAFGVVLAESIAHGVPVIASDCPHGPRDIVQPGHNGWLYPTNDEAQLHAWVKHVVDNRSALPEPTQVAQTVHPFTLSAVANRLEQALTATVGRQSTRRLSNAL